MLCFSDSSIESKWFKYSHLIFLIIVIFFIKWARFDSSLYTFVTSNTQHNFINMEINIKHSENSHDLKIPSFLSQIDQNNSLETNKTQIYPEPANLSILEEKTAETSNSYPEPLTDFTSKFPKSEKCKRMLNHGHWENLNYHGYERNITNSQNQTVIIDNPSDPNYPQTGAHWICWTVKFENKTSILTQWFNGTWKADDGCAIRPYHSEPIKSSLKCIGNGKILVLGDSRGRQIANIIRRYIGSKANAIQYIETRSFKDIRCRGEGCPYEGMKGVFGLPCNIDLAIQTALNENVKMIVISDLLLHPIQQWAKATVR